MSDQADEIQTYFILEADLPTVNKRLEKLNKRADKLGCSHAELVIHKEMYVVEGPNGSRKRVETDKLTEDDMLRPKYKMFEVTVEGAAPKLSGWTFIGTLDHYSLPGKVIVNTVPGHEIPECYHNSEGVCDHCGFVRSRKETFICVHENGEMKQIGRQCLKDFLGHNPQAVLWFMTQMQKLLDDMDDGFGGGWRGEQYYELKDVLKVAAAVIELYGWCPRSKANEDVGRRATSGLVFDYFHPPVSSNRKDREDWKKFEQEINNLFPKVEKQVEGSIAWVKEQEDKSEYMHNIKMIADSERINAKLMGYTCSIIAVYLKAMDALKAQAKKSNEWIEGEVNDKIEIKVTVERLRTIDSYFGPTRMHRMVDEKGRTVVWFCSGNNELKLGGEYKIRGTIKKFDEYNGWKQTMLKRVKALEVISEPNEDE